MLPLLSSLFSSGQTSHPSVFFETPRPPQTQERVSTRIKLHYFVDPRDVHEYSSKKWKALDEHAEQQYIHSLNVYCQNERVKQRQAMNDAVGWFGVDQVKLDAARKMDLKNCKKLKKLGLDYE